jgi:UDP-N-acetylglucosamine diphosphorylase/glucosamine-1-phosphate N-acetyltransferase
MVLPFRNIAVVILAAGMGTRMKSDKAKVLHRILGRPMIDYVVQTACTIAGDHVIVVVGHQAEAVRRVLDGYSMLNFALQSPQLGTGHAVACAMPKVPGQCDHVLILCGDVPLIRTETIAGLVEDHLADKRDVTVLAVELEDPTGYGRIVTGRDGRIAGIIEETDATPEQKKIRMINTGVYCVATQFLKDALRKIGSDNAQGEFYLTDMVGIGYRQGRRVSAFVAGDVQEFHGVNSQADLAAVAACMREMDLNIS